MTTTGQRRGEQWGGGHQCDHCVHRNDHSVRHDEHLVVNCTNMLTRPQWGPQWYLPPVVVDDRSMTQRRWPRPRWWEMMEDASSFEVATNVTNGGSKEIRWWQRQRTLETQASSIHNSKPDGTRVMRGRKRAAWAESTWYVYHISFSIKLTRYKVIYFSFYFMFCNYEWDLVGK